MGNKLLKVCYDWAAGFVVNMIMRKLGAGKEAVAATGADPGASENNKHSGINPIVSTAITAIVAAKPQLVTKPVGRVFDGIRGLVRNEKDLKNASDSVILYNIRENFCAILRRSIDGNPIVWAAIMFSFIYVGGKPAIKYILRKTRSLMSELTDSEVVEKYKQMSPEEIKETIRYANGDFGGNSLVTLPKNNRPGSRTRKLNKFESDKRKRQIELLRNQIEMQRLIDLEEE